MAAARFHYQIVAAWKYVYASIFNATLIAALFQIIRIRGFTGAAEKWVDTIDGNEFFEGFYRRMKIHGGASLRNLFPPTPENIYVEKGSVNSKSTFDTAL
jgi:hypothetical protein